tara:strand:- start:891 stop:1112 length:222 start_codon:yes stop_codon:yes gene_type:complete
MSDKKDLTKKNLEILTEDILKAMVTSLINGMKFKSDKDKLSYLKSNGYTHNHNSWSKTKLINFLLKFKPKVCK